jgi:hypothetical protein
MPFGAAMAVSFSSMRSSVEEAGGRPQMRVQDNRQLVRSQRRNFAFDG